MNISGLAAAPVAVVCYGNYRRVSIYTVVLLERKKNPTILFRCLELFVFADVVQTLSTVCLQRGPLLQTYKPGHAVQAVS